MIDALFVALLIPQFFAYLSDIILVSLAIIFLRDKEVLLIILTLTFIVVIKAVISDSFLVWRYLIPMLRPFIVLGLILSWWKCQRVDDYYKLRLWLLLTVFLTSAINIIGHSYDLSYVSINNFWNSDARFLGDTNMTVASIASLQQRYSSIFPQPATAGLAYFSLMYALMISKKHLPMSCFLLAVIAVLYSGLSSKSSFFHVALFVYVVFNVIFRLLPMYFRGLLFIFAMFAPTLLTFFLFATDILEVSEFAQGVLGPRYQESSYLHRLITSLDSMDYMFGVDGFDKLGMRIGDSAVVMRTVLAGIVFNFIYLISLSFLVLKLVNLFVPREYVCSVLSYYAVIGLGELGFTSFSQPGVVFLVFLPIILIYAQQKFLLRASLSYTSESSHRSKSCVAS